MNISGKFAFFFSLFVFCAQSNASGGLPMQAKAVGDGVYAVVTPSRELPNPKNRGWNSNSAFVVTGSGVMLFDTGSSIEIGHALKQTIASVTDQPVRWIVNSHAHGDHWLGNYAFKDSVKKIYASKQVASNIKTNGQSWVDRFNQMTGGVTGESTILPPDTYVDNQLDLSIGDKNIRLFKSGNSHSPGDILMWMSNQKILISGDVIYSDRMPSTLDSNLTNWIQLLEKLETMQPEVVIPGHGKVTDITGVSRLKGLLQTFWSVVEKEYEDGRADYEMVNDVIAALAKYEPFYPGLPEKVKRDISAVYLQVEAASF